MPTSPNRAVQRSPVHRMRPCASSTNARGIRSSAASSSSEHRGHSAENEQHAPQVRHMADPSSRIVAALMIPAMSFHETSAKRKQRRHPRLGPFDFGEDMHAQRAAKRGTVRIIRPNVDRHWIEQKDGFCKAGGPFYAG